MERRKGVNQVAIALLLVVLGAAVLVSAGPCFDTDKARTAARQLGENHQQQPPDLFQVFQWKGNFKSTGHQVSSIISLESETTEFASVTVLADLGRYEIVTKNSIYWVFENASYAVLPYVDDRCFKIPNYNWTDFQRGYSTVRSVESDEDGVINSLKVYMGQAKDASSGCVHVPMVMMFNRKGYMKKWYFAGQWWPQLEEATYFPPYFRMPTSDWTMVPGWCSFNKTRKAYPQDIQLPAKCVNTPYEDLPDYNERMFYRFGWCNETANIAIPLNLGVWQPPA